MAADFQPTQFQPVTLYDLPSIGFTQLMDGEASKAGFFAGVSESTGIGSGSLTPTERDSINSRFKEENGLTGIGGALVDIATNPWVWLSFLATPGAASALKKSGKGIFNVAPQYSAFVREKAPFLAGWNFLTANQALRNTSLLTAFRFIQKGRNEHLSLFEQMVGSARQQVIENLNKQGVKVRSLSPDKARLTDRERIRQLDVAIQGRLQGLDRDRTETVLELVEEMGEYQVTYVDGSTKTINASSLDDAVSVVDKTREALGTPFNIDEVTKPSRKLIEKERTVDAIMDQRTVDEVIESAGADVLVQAYRNYYNRAGAIQFLRDSKVARMTDEQLAAAFQNEETLKNLVDVDKVGNLWRSAVQRGDSAGERIEDIFSVAENRSDSPGLRSIREIMGLVETEAASARTMIQGEITEGTGNLIRSILSKNMSGGFYHPRLFDSVDVRGRSIRRKAIVDSGARTPETAVAAGHVLPRNATGYYHTYSLEDIETLRSLSGGNSNLLEALDKGERALMSNAASPEKSGFLTVKRLSANDAAENYANNTANTYGLFLYGKGNDEVWQAVTESQRENKRFFDRAELEGSSDHLTQTYNAGWSPTNSSILMDTPFKGGAGYWNLADVVNQGHGAVKNRQLRGIIKDTLIPNMLGRSSVQHSTENMLVHMTAAASKMTASLMKNIGIQKTEMGKGIIDRLEKFEDAPKSYVGAGTNGSLARYLYVSHLGFNPASIILNLTQPWLLGATMMGIGPVLKGYGKAFSELGGYMAKRLESGKLFISDQEKAKLIKESFSFADDLGISPDAFKTLDETLTSVATDKAGVWDRVSDAGMKLFEKAEWLNRLVVAHAVDDLYKTTGALRTAPKGARIRAVQEMIQESQFGADYLNTPMMFMGSGALGQWFSRPEMRQFLTFPLRSLTGVLVTSKQVNEGKRKMFGFDMPFARTVDFVRGMGISAGLYYAGRNLFDADMSKALFYNSMTDIVGGDPFNDYESPTDFLPVPPVIDLGYDAIRGVTSGDTQLLSNGLWRLVPGGIQISRALATAPQFMGLPSDTPIGRLANSFQRRYAAYDMITPQGEVPVFKGDGTFLEFRSPMELVTQGLGLDLNKSKVRSAETGYYVKQREMILGYRQEIISKMLSNDIPGAMRKKAEYEKRLGIPFSVTKEQLRQFMRNRQVPRNERILDRIPPEARSLYARYVANDMVNKEVDPSVFVDAPTSSARSRVMDRPRTFDLQADSVRAMEELMRQSEETKRLSEMGYSGFGSFRD